MDTEEIRRSVAAAGFIFRGSILHHWKGDAPAMPPEAGEIVATRIEDVLRSTPVLRGLAGQEALVVSRHAGALRQVKSPILFTEMSAMLRRATKPPGRWPKRSGRPTSGRCASV